MIERRSPTDSSQPATLSRSPMKEEKMGTSWRNKSRKPSLPYMRAGHCVALNVKSKDHDLRFGATAIAKGGQTILIRPEDRLLVLKARKVLTVDGKRHGKMTVCRFLTRGVEPGWNELYIRRDYLTSH